MKIRSLGHLTLQSVFVQLSIEYLHVNKTLEHCWGRTEYFYNYLLQFITIACFVDMIKKRVDFKAIFSEKLNHDRAKIRGKLAVEVCPSRVHSIGSWFFNSNDIDEIKKMILSCLHQPSGRMFNNNRWRQDDYNAADASSLK